MMEQVRRELEADVNAIGRLEESNDQDAADLKANGLAERLSSIFSLSDLVTGAFVVHDSKSGRSLALQLDPQLSAEMTSTLRRAAAIFLQLALDEEVITNALSNSIHEPMPMPEKFVMKDGAILSDAFGNGVLTDDYRYFVQTISKPLDLPAFKEHLAKALSPDRGGPPLLVISRYSGNAWWGGSYYDFQNKKKFRLNRFSPSQSYFYIRLNSDKMSAKSERHNDPRFWASKIAHEVLHNLGYWHPSYRDPAERDQFNTGNTRAFIVAYETFLLSKADRLTP